jgi:hypothetical protein
MKTVTWEFGLRPVNPSDRSFELRPRQAFRPCKAPRQSAPVRPDRLEVADAQIRISVGIEDSDQMIADLREALAIV